MTYIDLTLFTLELKSYATCICIMQVRKVYAYMRHMCRFINTIAIMIKMSGLLSCEGMFVFRVLSSSEQRLQLLVST